MLKIQIYYLTVLTLEVFLDEYQDVSMAMIFMEDLYTCFFQLQEVTCISWLMAPSPIFKASITTTSEFFLTLTLLAPSYKDPCDYTGPTYICQDNLLNLLNYLTSAKPLCHVRFIGCQYYTMESLSWWYVKRYIVGG